MNATHELVNELRTRVREHCIRHGIAGPRAAHPVKFRPRLRLRPDLHDLVISDFTDHYFAGAVEGQTVVAVCGFPVTRGPGGGSVAEFEIVRAP